MAYSSSGFGFTLARDQFLMGNLINEPAGTKSAVSWERYHEFAFTSHCPAKQWYSHLEILSRISRVPLLHIFRGGIYMTILRACKDYRDGRVRIGFLIF